MQRLPWQPKNSHDNHPSDSEGLGTLVVAGGQGPVLLAASEQVLDQMTTAVGGTIEGAGAVFRAIRGRPRPRRRMAPWRSSGSKTVASCCCPGVRTTVSGLPCPAALRCTLVEQPPWLLPSASVAGAPPWPQRHAGGRGSRCRRRTGRSSPPPRPCRPVVGPPRRSDPRSRPAASARSGCRPSTRDRIAPADRARVLQSARATGCH